MNSTDLYRDKLSDEDVRLIEQIEAEADKTPARDKGLALHVGAIEKLRAKGYSYRDIAAWFCERNIKATHVDVWRAHKNSLPIIDRADLAEHDEDWGEYVKTKREGNVTNFEEVDHETSSCSVQPENTPADSAEVKKQLTKRNSKTVRKN